MPSRWFRIAYARNALLRLLAEERLELDSLTLAEGIRAMQHFIDDWRPQHGEVDELEAQWGPADDGFELALVRRMRRHNQPEVRVSLVFGYAARVDRSERGTASLGSARDVRGLTPFEVVRGSRPRARRIDQD